MAENATKYYSDYLRVMGLWVIPILYTLFKVSPMNSHSFYNQKNTYRY